MRYAELGKQVAVKGGVVGFFQTMVFVHQTRPKYPKLELYSAIGHGHQPPGN
jgi:hypothetical protein